ncbi:protein-tyrosine phosphatase family protein [[Actinomadura] parvosata]|uniref:protein-tyrosine phosphatase family protein n=1 Tax=[Actinomadura] parvosata TaxID=1955412 RepID=UPI001C90875E
MGSGTLSVTRRPQLRALPGIASLGVTHVVTLLSRHEGALQLGSAVRALGLPWIWIPLPGAAPPPPTSDQRLGTALMQVSSLLRDGGHVLVHCSAGIHRTGMFAYALLRFTGMTAEEAALSLERLSAVMAAEVGDHRLAWADHIYATWRG